MRNVVLTIVVALAAACGGTPVEPDRDGPVRPPPDGGSNADPVPSIPRPTRTPADLDGLVREIVGAYVRARTAARLERARREIVFESSGGPVLIGFPDDPREEIRYPDGVTQTTPRTRVTLHADGGATMRIPRDAVKPEHVVILRDERNGRAIAIDVQVDGSIRSKILLED